MIEHIEELNRLAQSKCDHGCRRALIKLADKYNACGDAKRVIKGFLIAKDLGYWAPQNVITFVDIPNGLLVFEKPPEEVRAIIESAVPEPKQEVPRTTLVRMVYKRLHDVKTTVDLANAHSLRTYQWHVSNGHAPSPYVKEVFPEIRNKEELIRELTRLGKTFFEVKRILKEFQKSLFIKKELTDDVISEAMDLMVASMVIEE